MDKYPCFSERNVNEGQKEKKKISIRKIALSRGGGMEEPKRT